LAAQISLSPADKAGITDDDSDRRPLPNVQDTDLSEPEDDDLLELSA